MKRIIQTKFLCDEDPQVETLENGGEEQKKLEIVRIGNEHHSLFKTPVPEKAEIEVLQIIPERNHYELFVGAFMEDKAGLHHLLKELRMVKPEDTIEVRIASGGGLISEGITLVNALREKFKGNIVTIIDSYAYSMGALLFCVGDKRVVYEHSELMLHDYSSGAIGKGSEIHSRIEFSSRFVRNAFKNWIKDYLTEDEISKMIDGKDFWFDSEEMCRRGMATHVIVGDKELTAKQFLGEEPIVEEVAEDEEQQLFLDDEIIEELRGRGYFKTPKEIEELLKKEKEAAEAPKKGKISRKKKEKKSE